MLNHHFRLSEGRFARLEPLPPNKPRGVPRQEDDRRATKRGPNSGSHAGCDCDGKPLISLSTEGQVGDCRGAASVPPAPPDADVLIADRGCDRCEARFREALADQRVEPRIPGRKNRKQTIECDAERHRQRDRIERMFGRLKDWRRITTRTSDAGSR